MKYYIISIKKLIFYISKILFMLYLLKNKAKNLI